MAGMAGSGRASIPADGGGKLAKEPARWSLVAGVRYRRVQIFRSRHAHRSFLRLGARTPDGAPTVFLVRSRRHGWAKVALPTRPNGSTGWVRRWTLRFARNPYRLKVDLSRHRLTLWRGRHSINRWRVAVGKRSTPTPVGLYYLTELLRPPDPHGAFGPYAYTLSAHSPVLHDFLGGDGVVGLHGTDEPRLLGRSVSHGCVRISNRAIRKLARRLPLGTPILIRR